MLILSDIPIHNCSASLPDNQIRSQLDYSYDNDNKWDEDIINKYCDNNVDTTGVVRCPKMRSISCVIPENGTLSFSWMMRSRDDYSNFKFSRNNDKNIEECASFSSWSNLLTYEVKKGDILKWVFNFESPPCKSGQGWLYINYTRSKPSNESSPDDNTPNIISNDENPNEDLITCDGPYCRCSIDMTPIDPKPGNNKRTINLRISSNKTKIKKANIQLNYSQCCKIESNGSSGFLEGFILESDETNKRIDISLSKANSQEINGSITLKLILSNPENNSIFKVCIESIMLKDIDDNDVEIEIPNRCYSSTYTKRGTK
jgi:hypothetical protein